MVGLVETWLKNRPIRSAKLTMGNNSLELVDASRADLERITEAFIATHTKQ